MLLRNVRIVLTDGTTEPASVLIEGRRITRVVDSTEVPPASSQVVDLTGLTLFPGFIDIHIHGAAGVDTMDTTADGLHKIAVFLRNNGVTAWVPTLVPASPEGYERAIRAISEVIDDQKSHLPFPEARVLGVHYEGPFVNDEQCGALHREHFRTFKQISDVDSLPTLPHSEAIHMTTLAPEIEGGIALINELTRRSWIVSIGHTRATVDILDQAFAEGARHMTHFMNAMTPLHHRAPGPIGWGLMNDQVTCDLIADGIHLDQSILKLILRNKTSKRVSLISDAIAATGLGDGEYQIWGETIVVKNNRTRNSHGSIAGSVITIIDALRMMLSLGSSESEVAQMAALNPARLLKLDHDCGSIEAGKRADLVALDEKRQVRLTIIGGQIAFQDLPS
ncbi:MAG TPA: N-acetylglucosamine-6-phosphate deacetylase [Pyrinomonadaceae bacterium]|nr:N-acetylglucosamine-6-phosphate deacetylase [Pyrinomonadaceae bacterium]